MHPRLVRTLRSDVSISRRKKGSRAGEEIISSKDPEWLFDLFDIFCLVGINVYIYIYLAKTLFQGNLGW